MCIQFNTISHYIQNIYGLLKGSEFDSFLLIYEVNTCVFSAASQLQVCGKKKNNPPHYVIALFTWYILMNHINSSVSLECRNICYMAGNFTSNPCLPQTISTSTAIPM